MDTDFVLVERVFLHTMQVEGILQVYTEHKLQCTYTNLAYM